VSAAQRRLPHGDTDRGEEASPPEPAADDARSPLDARPMTRKEREGLSCVCRPEASAAGTSNDTELEKLKKRLQFVVN
jgi:hypothetical protein